MSLVAFGSISFGCVCVPDADAPASISTAATDAAAFGSVVQNRSVSPC
ncbi:hypothetical protein PC116_g2935 [Phytophthora cactorum]|nr:hypothetical protein Pcac1_g16758 [Phytophthora cactorum]KAG3016883.1 hypothetical protein PC120_g11347 [Phytophthora cactorum]KAG4053718.1 hypothetical protein PC123_g11132 [Phytophthora cactorum]KAG4249383.1 hypothetical protein PC116_g2935 [Phytophthora cactorum]